MRVRSWILGVVLIGHGGMALEPALAVSQQERRWLPRRHPGAPLEPPPPPPPSGWRLGASLTFPYTSGVGLAYMWPGTPATFKVGAGWGILGESGVVAFNFSDFRLYGSLLYFLVPAARGGPYVETGLGLARSSGAVLPVSWPLLPHIGFGTTGRLNAEQGWDVSFSATANGLLALEGGLLF